MRIKKRLWATLACFALLITQLPAAAFATDSGAIRLCTDGIASPVHDTATVYHYIYFGNNGTNPIKWRVLDAAKGNATGIDDILSDGMNTVTNSSAMFLLSDGFVGSSKFNASNISSAYHVSDVRTTLDGSTNDTSLRKTCFSATEQSAMLATTKSDPDFETYSTATNPILNGDMLFLPSIHEAFSTDYFPDISDRFFGSWWLRSPSLYFRGHFQAIAIVFSGGYISSPVENPRDLRPAFNLDKSAVLFTSAANNSGQNMSFAVPAAYSGTEWKLTLKDGNSFATGTSLTSGNTTLPVDYSAETLTFTHATLNSFTDAGYTDVTATLTNASGELLYYGSAENTGTDATSSTITIPTGLAVGNYTLSLYGEDRNAANATDYATGTPFTHTITVSTPTVSGVTVEPNTQSVAKGGSQIFTATVIGSNSPAQTVTWSVTGNASASTTISGGTLTVGSDETATTLTVKATSTVDNTQSGSATVTVTSTTPPGTDPIQYQFMKGQNGEWTKGSNKDLSFTANGEYSKFTGVRVDGSAISNDNYTSESGSTIVKLKALYLETLSLGRHTLRVDFTDGYAETSFTIDGYISIPKTGDNSRPMLWLGIALVAGAGLAAIIVIRRKLQNG